MFGNMYEIWIDRLPLLLAKRLMLMLPSRVWLGGVMLLHDLVVGGEGDGEGGCLLP